MVGEIESPKGIGSLREALALTWNAALETGGILVGEDVAITLEVQFVKA